MQIRGFAAASTVAAFGSVVLVACAGGTLAPTGAPTGAPTAPTSAAAEVPTPTGTRSPTTQPTLPADAAPAELQGSWQVELAPGDVVILEIGRTSFSINRGSAGGSGRISVVGDEITFSRVAQCMEGIGTYRWAIEGETLTFVEVGPRDPCGRREVLVDVVYERRGS